ncbi:hypothetical protein, partial [Pseudomonas lundensis]|uniref:hypothetical protein n=1 Tax=Pseudomonas lundensis TaxID=86185 RepID=UPI001BAE8951
HLGLLALMAVYFTENRISWVYVQSLVTRKMAPSLDPFVRVVVVVVFIMAAVMLTIVFGMSVQAVSRCQQRPG